MLKLTLMILHYMVWSVLLSGVGAYYVSEAYKKYATPEQKRKLENFVKLHHGEAGAILVGTSILTKSPHLAASGIGLMTHDHKDYKKWFTGDKYNYYNYA